MAKTPLHIRYPNDFVDPIIGNEVILCTGASVGDGTNDYDPEREPDGYNHTRAINRLRLGQLELDAALKELPKEHADRIEGIVSGMLNVQRIISDREPLIPISRAENIRREQAAQRRSEVKK